VLNSMIIPQGIGTWLGICFTSRIRRTIYFARRTWHRGERQRLLAREKKEVAWPEFGAISENSEAGRGGWNVESLKSTGAFPAPGALWQQGKRFVLFAMAGMLSDLEDAATRE